MLSSNVIMFMYNHVATLFIYNHVPAIFLHGINGDSAGNYMDEEFTGGMFFRRE
jgi:hypothetical protein